MFKKIHKLFGADEIPYGVKVMMRITAIRWIGWGIVTPLLPVFIYSFSRNYMEAGLIKSAYDVAFILVLPLVGMATDRFLSGSIIALGMALYAFVGFSYFLAGATGLVLFVILGRFLNGFSFALDSIGRQTYIWRYVSRKQIASNMGFVDTFSNLWWILAAISSLWLIKYFTIDQLALAIIPTTLISMVIALRFRKHERKEKKSFDMAAVKKKVVSKINYVKDWGWELKTLATFRFFISAAKSVIMFFVPIAVYSESGSLSQSIIIGIVFNLPYLFSWNLGKLFDKKGAKSFMVGLIVLALSIAAFGLRDSFYWQLATAFIVGVSVELLYLGANELVTLHAHPEHFGRVGGVMASIADMGALAGPIAIGALIDLNGIQSSFIWLASFIVALSLIFYFIRHSIFHKPFEEKGLYDISHHRGLSRRHI